MTNSFSYDVIVVGGGHAGCEAAAAAARCGAHTALLTHRTDTIGAMSCNPAIGGVGKGHLVREVDALDGLMGRVADAAGIQFRLLNRSKGPAVQGPRAQADRARYGAAMQAELAQQDGLEIRGAAVEDLVLERGEVVGVVTADGDTHRSAAVVLTTGTFLNGRIHRGAEQWGAGRAQEKPAIALARRLYALGLPMGRLKTGTPPRLDGRTIDYAACAEQKGDASPQMFSLLSARPILPQLSCYITATNEQTHALIKNAPSPLYDGQITAPGPRYCPSIEDKVHRFADRRSHQVFLEPEGLDDDTVYPNGLATSLPEKTQLAFLRTMRGLERVEVRQMGYAIEYDYLDPRELLPNLESRSLPRLFGAGQINGTTGYEEAAAQGVIAGINAAARASGAAPLVPSRAEAYIGVMLDDLRLKGAAEPYRMFTARSEYRLSLRADNADARLTPLGIKAGCVGAKRKAAYLAHEAAYQGARASAAKTPLSAARMRSLGVPASADGAKRTLMDVLAHAGCDWERISAAFPETKKWSERVRARLSADGLYAGYLERQKADIAAFQRDEARRLPPQMDYAALPGLTRELADKLAAARPATLGAAARLEGMTPAALVLLLHHLARAPAA